MKITNIRLNNKKISKNELDHIFYALVFKLKTNGYITEYSVNENGSVKVGMHMKCFVIDTILLGYNARLGRYIKSPKGYIRTNIPTWDQRVEFNNIINKYLDNLNITCTIKSGEFIIRCKTDGAKTEDDWDNQDNNRNDKYNGMYELCSAIRNEKDTREELDSDRLEQQHKNKKFDQRKHMTDTIERGLGL